MSFLGDYQRTGAGASIKRSLGDIRETLIEKPKREEKEKRLEAERVEDREYRKKKQGQQDELDLYNLETARSTIKEHRERKDMRDQELAIAKSKVQQELAITEARNKKVDPVKVFHSKTTTRSGHEKLMAAAAPLFDEDGKMPAWGENWAIKQVAENVDLQQNFVAGEAGAYEKSIKEIDLLIDNFIDKGKSNGLEEEYKKTYLETWRTAERNGNLKNPEKELTLADLRALKENHGNILANIVDRKKKSEKLIVWMNNGTQEQQVFQGSSSQNKLKKAGWGFGRRPKPDYAKAEEIRSQNKASRDIAKMINDNKASIAKIYKEAIEGEGVTPAILIQIKGLEKTNKDLELQQSQGTPAAPVAPVAAPPAAVTTLPPPVQALQEKVQEFRSANPDKVKAFDAWIKSDFAKLKTDEDRIKALKIKLKELSGKTEQAPVSTNSPGVKVDEPASKLSALGKYFYPSPQERQRRIQSNRTKPEIISSNR